VKIAFSAGKSIGGKTRVRNTIKEQRQEIQKLSNENEKITNKYKALLKKNILVLVLSSFSPCKLFVCLLGTLPYQKSEEENSLCICDL
jgi:hypothetical protein